MKKYIAPEAETVALAASDVIASSVTGYGENEQEAQTWSWKKS